jgi:methyl-accepting chemotaxis protein
VKFNWINNLSISVKFTLIIVVILIILIGNFVFIGMNIQQAKASIDQFNAVTYIARLVSEARIAERDYVYHGGSNDSVIVRNNLDELLARAEQTKSRLTQPEDVAEMDVLIESAQGYKDSFNEVMKTGELARTKELRMVNLIQENLQKSTIALRENQEADRNELLQKEAHHSSVIVKVNQVKIANQMEQMTLSARIAEREFIRFGKEVDMETVQANISEVLFLSSNLRRTFTETDDQKLIDSIIEASEGYLTSFEQYVNLSKKVNQHEAVMAEQAQQLQESATNIRASLEQQFAALQTRVLMTVIAVFIGSPLVMGVILWVFARSFLGRINSLKEMSDIIATVDLPALSVELQAMAGGDLTRSYQVQVAPRFIHGNDEIGQMAVSFNGMILELRKAGQAFEQMIQNIRGLVGHLSDNAEGLAVATEQLSAIAEQSGNATQQVAASTQEQARGITQSAEITNQISVTLEQVNGKIQQVSHDAAETVQLAHEGASTVEASTREMENIRNRVNVSAQKVKEMGYRSEEIGAIVDTIDEIASQTNLLALNAAIEAARAGEHGKGFAVVADEVRKLAEKSAQATREINTLIKDIRKTVGEAVTAMDEGVHEVETGVLQAGESAVALAKILKAAQDSSQQAEEITLLADDTNNSLKKLVGNMDTVSAVVEENSAATEEMAAQVEEVTASTQALSEMAQGLQVLVGQFNVGDSDINIVPESDELSFEAIESAQKNGRVVDNNGTRFAGLIAKGATVFSGLQNRMMTFVRRQKK